MASFEEANTSMQRNILVHVHSNAAMLQDEYERLAADAMEEESKGEKGCAMAIPLPLHKKGVLAPLLLLALCSGAFAGRFAAFHGTLPASMIWLARLIPNLGSFCRLLDIDGLHVHLVLSSAFVPLLHISNLDRPNLAKVVLLILCTGRVLPPQHIVMPTNGASSIPSTHSDSDSSSSSSSARDWLVTPLFSERWLVWLSQPAFSGFDLAATSSWMMAPQAVPSVNGMPEIFPVSGFWTFVS